METAQPPVEPEKKSKVGLFIGCGCLTVILLGVGFVALLVFGVFGALKSNEAYKDSLALVQKHPEAIAALGEPIEPGMVPSGSVNFNNGEGSADLTIPVSGPKGSGVLRVVASKSAGAPNWVYSTRELTVTGQTEAIQLGP